MASNWIGKIATRLVRPPKNLVMIGADVATAATETKSEYHLRRMPNDIDTLSPKNRFVVAINKRPLTRHHPVSPDHRRSWNRHSRNSSDGVVAYWTRILTTRVRKIVPSGHGTHQNPQESGIGASSTAYQKQVARGRGPLTAACKR